LNLVPQNLFSYVRAERRRLGQSSCSRTQFLDALVRAALSATTRERLAHLPFSLFFSEEEASIGAVPEDVQTALRADPLLIGWAYQIWNESTRDANSWGISRQDSMPRSPMDIAAATQIFTEEYMADYVSSHAIQGDSLRVCDPACVTGHLLVSALRAGYQRMGCRQTLMSLFGCDIDPIAVSLCRIILLLEAVRLGESDLEAAWKMLERSIVAVPPPYGALDRSGTHPILSQRYDVILANPPYLGRRKLESAMREFLDREYPDTAVDLCAAFMERCFELLRDGGRMGLVTTDRWLRLKGYRRVRNGGKSFAGMHRALTIQFLCELGDRAFDSRLGLHDGVRVVLLSAERRPPPAGHHFHFMTLAHLNERSEKGRALAGGEGDCTELPGVHVRRVAQQRLIDERHDEVFLESSALPSGLVLSPQRLSDCAAVVVGLQTNDDRRFTRYQWEVEPDPSRWRIHAKGGGYGRWFGLNRTVLDWGRGHEIFHRSPRSGISVAPWFEREGWVYSWFANGCLGLRVKDRGWSFGRAAASGVFCEDRRIIAFLNSSLGSLCVRRIGAKVQLPEGVVRRIPIPSDLSVIDGCLVDWAVAIKRDIVRRDVTDSTFDPSCRTSLFEVYALEALLRMVEGLIESQVLNAVQMTRGAALDAGVASVGLLHSAFQFDCDELWRFLPATYEPLRAMFNGTRAVVGAERGVEDDEIRRAVLSGRGRGARTFALPPDGPLERMCQQLTVHPCELFCRLVALAEQDAAVAETLHKPLLEQRLGVAILDLLGHTWWINGMPRRRPGFGAQDIREIGIALAQMVAEDESMIHLGTSLDEWLAGRCQRWFRTTFGTRPPVVGVPHKSGYITHCLEVSPRESILSDSGLIPSLL